MSHQSSHIIPGSEWVAKNFALFEATLNGAKAKPFHKVRKDALAIFSGFPSVQNEDWKYTNLSDLAQGKYKLVSAAGNIPRVEEALKRFELEGTSTYRLVYVDGVFKKDLSRIPTGIEILTSGEAFEQRAARSTLTPEKPFQALNTAFLREGAYIKIEKTISKPIEIVQLYSTHTEPTVIFPRVMVDVAPHAQVRCIEIHASSQGTFFSCPVTELSLQEGSLVDYYTLQFHGSQVQHIGTLNAQIDKGATCRTHTISFGSALARNEIHPVLAGDGSECILNGLTVLNAEQHVDNHTVIDHVGLAAQSTELFKGIYAEKAKGVFSGTIVVSKGAQKTNAIQSNQAILLSDSASIESRPQLKIWADDVKCTHGATVGRLDDNSLFYLRSRGVGESEARQMLIHAFASDVISAVQIPMLKDLLERELEKKLKEIF